MLYSQFFPVESYPCKVCKQPALKYGLMACIECFHQHTSIPETMPFEDVWFYCIGCSKSCKTCFECIDIPCKMHPKAQTLSMIKCEKLCSSRPSYDGSKIITPEYIRKNFPQDWWQQPHKCDEEEKKTPVAPVAPSPRGRPKKIKILMASS